MKKTSQYILRSMLTASLMLQFSFSMDINQPKRSNTKQLIVNLQNEKQTPLIQYCLGTLYLNKENIGQGPLEAMRYYSMAANQGHAIAQYALAEMIYNGIGCEKNLLDAIKYYHLAAVQGLGKAQQRLGACYFLGEGVKKDEEEALKWHRLAAKQSDEFYKKECFAYRYINVMSADSPDPTDQCQLGIMYYNGEGIEKNYAEAVRYYRLAADQGNANGQNGLGNCYYNGEGVEKNYAEAARQFSRVRVGSRFFSRARYNMGLALAQANDLEKASPGLDPGCEAVFGQDHSQKEE